MWTWMKRGVAGATLTAGMLFQYGCYIPGSAALGSYFYDDYYVEDRIIIIDDDYDDFYDDYYDDFDIEFDFWW